MGGRRTAPSFLAHVASKTLLAGHGIKMIIVEDIPRENKWYNIVIDGDGNVNLVSAGERGYKTSTLQVTDNATDIQLGQQ